MAAESGGKPVDAVRAAPGEFFLATDRITRGLRFAVGEDVFEVVGDPFPPGHLTVLARIRDVATGAELTASLRGGRRVPNQRDR